mmetsp:Transcript_1036/g.2332  ORF Transcript_1036/g.2332 Transcript_1036/m.2332 type:complete len:252 (-) Transcript_1036:166-921(-)
MSEGGVEGGGEVAQQAGLESFMLGLQGAAAAAGATGAEGWDYNALAAAWAGCNPMMLWGAGCGMYPAASGYDAATLAAAAAAAAQPAQVVKTGGSPSMGSRSYDDTRPSKGSKGKGFERGDWICPACGDHVFGRNNNCRRCGAPRPSGDGSDGGALSSGFQGGKGSEFARGANAMARGSGAFGVSGPPRRAGGGQKPMPGDWICPSCGDLQFARNAQCRMCGGRRPVEEDHDPGPKGGRSDHRERSRSRGR